MNEAAMPAKWRASTPTSCQWEATNSPPHPHDTPHSGLTMHRGRIRCVAKRIFLRACPKSHSVHRLQLVDHAFDDLETLVPELGVAGIETERREELGMVFRP